MRRILSALVLALSVSSPALAAPALPLGHAGRWITDARGRVVITQGLNMVAKRPPYRPDALGFGADDARFLARNGFDSVRLGVIYAAVEPQPGVYDDAYLDRIERTVDLLGRRGIVSLLDFHQDLYNERFEGEGFPDWAVDDDGLPAEPKRGFPINYVLMPALQRAFDNFWDNAPGPDGIGLQDRYAAAWAHVARRFRANRFVLGYDLINEPWPGTQWSTCLREQGCPDRDRLLDAFTRRTMTAIRTADRRHLVFYEPWVLFNSGGATSIGPFGDRRAGMSFHDICASAGASGSYRGCEEVDERVLRNAERQSARTGDALLMTEFGSASTRPLLEPVLARADRFMVGWQDWHYCGCDDPTTGREGDAQALVRDPAKPPRGDNVVGRKLALLRRPHPRAVAGTPRRYRYDAARRRFELRWSTRRADGHGRFGAGARSEIPLPPALRARRAGVAVRGGRVRSRRGARVLEVAACRRARNVRLVVGRGVRSRSSC